MSLLFILCENCWDVKRRMNNMNLNWTPNEICWNCKKKHGHHDENEHRAISVKKETDKFCVKGQDAKHSV